MLLHTPTYLLFLAFVSLIYWRLKIQKWRKLFLLCASYIFYALFDLRFLAILLGLTILNFLIGLEIPRSRYSKMLALANVGINLSVLGVFKYANFFLDSLEKVLNTLGFQTIPVGLLLLLPVGISFYTFQGISYTTEIYRNKLSPSHDFVDFALYLGFFPKLIAGPFVRPRNFFEQLSKPASPLDIPKLRSSLGLLLLGLTKKIIIADGLASLADISFRAASMAGNGISFPTPLYIRGFYLYAFQIYADFSGYTDIARASARLLGLDLPKNFQQPYLASTLTSFWNRWHMSLTQWFREYIFFPLSRKFLTKSDRRYNRLIQISVTIITMLLIGFWHGPAWTYIAWGLWHGIWLSIENLSGFKSSTKLVSLVFGLITFHLVGIGWVVFRSDSFATALSFLYGLTSFNQMNWLAYYLPPVLFTACLVFAIDLGTSRRLMLPANRLGRLLSHSLITATVLVLTGLIILGLVKGTDVHYFIYSQF
jgi:alginate O-acetyltransferase complex protein AlgI